MATKDNVQGVVLALFGASAGGHLAALTADATAHGLTATAGNLAASAGFILGKDLTTNAAFRDNMLTGLGIPSTNSAYAAAAEWANGELAKTNANRGEIVATAVAYLAGLTDTASPFYAAAAAYRATVTAAVAWSEGAGATVFGVAELQAQQGTAPVEGDVISFTVAADDALEGTDGNDTFEGTSLTIGADESVDGGAGTDDLNIIVKGNVAAVAVSNVENINLDLQSFGEATVDLTDVEAGVVVNIAQTVSGYAKTVSFTEGGENEYVLGAGVTGATFGNQDGGKITTGASTTAITLTQTSAEVNLEVTANKVTLTDTATSGTQLAGSIATGATLDIASGTKYESIELTGAGTLQGTGVNFEGATIAAEDITLVLDDVATNNSMDLANISVGKIRLSDATAHAYAFTNAENAEFEVKTDVTSFKADTGADGGTFVVDVNAESVDLIVTAAATNSKATEVNHDGATVNLNGTSLVTTVTNVTVGGDTTLNVTGAKFTITTLAEANTAAVATLTGNQALTISTATNTTVDGSAYTGAITLTNKHTTASTIKTGSAVDTVTSDTAAKDASQYYYLDGGNDVLDITAFEGDAGVGLFADLGAGDDKVQISGAGAFVEGSIIIDGGEGNDTLYLKSTGGIDFHDGSVALRGIETIQLASSQTYEFDASTLSGQTLAITGSAAADEHVKIFTADTETSIDLSGLTYTNVDTSTIDFTDTKASSAFTGTLTAMADTVTGPDTGVYGFTLDLGAGKDTITLVASGGAGSGGTLTLGAGADTINIATNSSESGSNKLVKVTDFAWADDTLNTLYNAVGADTKAVDVSDATTLATDSIAAYVKNGMVKLLGDDAANIDTLAEWVKVVRYATVAQTADGVYGFEFNGNTYVIDIDDDTTFAATVEKTCIELTGVTGMTIGFGGGTNVIVLS